MSSFDFSFKGSDSGLRQRKPTERLIPGPKPGPRMTTQNRSIKGRKGVEAQLLGGGAAKGGNEAAVGKGSRN